MVLLYLPTLWKESLNSGGQQFHQYQQNKQTTKHLENKQMGGGSFISTHIMKKILNSGG